MQLGTLWRTLRRLKFSQLGWRLYQLFDRRRRITSHRAGYWSWNISRAPGLKSGFPPMPVMDRFNAASAEGNTIERLARGCWEHLHHERKIGREVPDWQLGPIATGRLWVITLHYHKWAFELASAAAGSGPDPEQAAHLFRHYLADWIARCRLEAPGARDLAWNAYAIATRLTWWIRSYHVLGRVRWQQRDRFERDFLTSLWQQAAYLHDHLEWDLRQPPAEGCDWARVGWAILCRTCRRPLAADGYSRRGSPGRRAGPTRWRSL